MSSSCTFDIQLVDHPVAYQPLDATEDTGAEAVFLGRTRAETHAEHGPLLKLDYEAHPDLALSTMRQIAEEAAARFAALAVRLHHATGPVGIGEASVLVQVRTGHRAEAFEAGRFLIDELKRRVPIWKREVWADDHSWAPGTVANTEPTS